MKPHRTLFIILVSSLALLCGPGPLAADQCSTNAILRVDDPPNQVWVIKCSGSCTCYKVSNDDYIWCDCDEESDEPSGCCHMKIKADKTDKQKGGTYYDEDCPTPDPNKTCGESPTPGPPAGTTALCVTSP